ATGRTNFEAMLRFFKTHPDVRVLLCERTDRLYRNLKDWVTTDDLDIEIHFVKEGVEISRESKSAEKFMHGIKVLMAKNYIDNLSEKPARACAKNASKADIPVRHPSATSMLPERTERRHLSSIRK